MATKKKQVTLRQRLRQDAEKYLENLIERTAEAIQPIAKDSGLKVEDLAKLVTSGDHKTLAHDCVTTLTNAKERELERLYNSQMDLIQDDAEEVAA
ncbi:MAG: hypothetical protein AMJ84_04555 [Acidithiobacillales bacterium SM23_46]|jgi:vacuolar-type H+-ATPase subunit E/Vma4|nr:MAG: hypothetical protein AMJ84_04555 [Acidithiobacillales bacterium SM23_46]